jgi:hypothetical protein
MRTNPELSGRLANREPAAAKQEGMYFLREEKSREGNGGGWSVSDLQINKQVGNEGTPRR